MINGYMDIVLRDIESEVRSNLIHPRTWMDFCRVLSNLDTFKNGYAHTRIHSASNLLRNTLRWSEEDMMTISGQRNSTHTSMTLEYQGHHTVRRPVEKGKVNPVTGMYSSTFTQKRFCTAYLTLTCLEPIHQRFMEDYFHGIDGVLGWND
jgi:hypothetical protein